MFAQGGLERLGASDIITVVAAGATLASTPMSTGPGGTVTASYAGVATPTPTDWVGLYATGTPDASYIARWNTTGQASASNAWLLPGTLATGTYELRLFANNTFNRLATGNTFSVGPGPIISTTSISVSVGGSVTVNWQNVTGPAATDWLALVRVNAPDTSYVSWAFTGGAASGTLTLPVPTTVAPGTYEVRMFKQNWIVKLGVSNAVTVTP
jgi:hypothetical protein